MMLFFIRLRCLLLAAKLIKFDSCCAASRIWLQTMAWILDEYSKFHGHSPAVVTGKPIVRTERKRYGLCLDL